MTIARQAWLPVAAAVVVSGLVYFLCGPYCSLPLIIIAVSLLYLFRDPQRRIPPTPLGVVSPVDGRIVAVGEIDDPFLGREAVKLSIRMRPLGPWVVRSAMEGRVLQVWYLPKGLDPQVLADMDKRTFAEDPRARQAHFAMWVQSDELDDVVIALRGPFILGRLRCGVQAGDRIGQGRRFGLLFFPVTADVYVPAASRIEMRQGGTVRAGSDIIATLMHKEKPAAMPAAG
jgi:phosphatidylserine decarboxylase